MAPTKYFPFSLELTKYFATGKTMAIRERKKKATVEMTSLTAKNDTINFRLGAFGDN